METTDPTSGNLRGLERKKDDVSDFHESDSARRSETKSSDARDVSIEDESNAHDASTTHASPSDSHARYASASDTRPRRSKRLSLQKKPDTRNTHKCVHTYTVINSHVSTEDKTINDESLSNKKTPK